MRVTAAGESNAALIGPVALAVALTAPFLGGRSFWLDESLSVTLARLEWSEFTNTVAERENNMTLYHLLLRGWTAFGTSETFIRALSLLLALVALVAFYALARRLFGPGLALGASAFLAANPVFVHYAREARGYALCLALVTVASYLFVLGLDRPGWPVWIAYAAVSALAVYAHLFAVLVPAAHAASLLLFKGRIPWRPVVAAAALLALALAPFLALATSAQASGIEWAAENAIGRVFVDLQERVPVPGALAAVALAAGAAVYSVLRIRRSRLGGRPETWRWGFVLAWLLVPVALIVLISFFATPAFVIRYFIIVLPPLVLLLVLGAAALLPRRAVVPAVALATAASAAFTLSWNPTAEERWEEATREVGRQARPGDGVLFYPAFVRVPFQLYLDELPRAEAQLEPVYPRPPWGEGLLRVIKNVPMTQETVVSEASRHDRIWLVLSHSEFGDPEEYEDVRQGLAVRFRRDAERRFVGVTVVEYERR